ncbi:MAG TPA: hypothetical protein VG273_06225 [Bryobacteraceae bacterium]|nr:hypothetical protein [Bryobacteraceae bacterium]
MACVNALLALSLPGIQAFGQTGPLGGQLRILTNAQTGTSYNVVLSDCGKLVTFANPNNVAVVLPAAGDAGLPNGCWIDIQNTGPGTATFTASGSTVDGSAGFALLSNQGLRILSNGAAYYTQRGQGSSNGGGALSIQSSGTSLGPAATLNIVSGTGFTCIPQVNAGVMTFQCNADTSILATKATLQGGSNPQICVSSSGSGSTYAASCGTTLTAYAARQTLFWYADVPNASTTPTLNIDTLGAKTMVRQDGSALAINDIRAGTLYRIWHDGTSIRVVEAGLGSGSGGGSTPVIPHAIGFTFDGGGAALTAGTTKYLTVPFACTITAWNMAVDAGTATVKTWKTTTGTAVPTAANSISTTGVSISSGTAIHSANLSDFTTTSIATNDILGFNLSAVSGATQVNFIVECDQ